MDARGVPGALAAVGDAERNRDFPGGLEKPGRTNVEGERTLIGRRWNVRATDGQRARDEDACDRESGNRVIE
jgi:hypothetical protein